MEHPQNSSKPFHSTDLAFHQSFIHVAYPPEGHGRGAAYTADLGP